MGSKLAVLYDLLDGGSYAKGLKQANSLLEKNPRSGLVKSLKAFGLEKLGRVEEANQVCDEILSQQPLDEGCLHPLKLVLRNLHRLQDITRIYEAAHAANPNDEAAAVDLFAAYVRDGNLIKQQQLAMKLLKLSGGKERYQWWVILSIMLQAKNALPPPSPALPAGAPAAPTPSSDAGLDSGKLLQLAESMAGRTVSRTGRAESIEALLVYLDLLLARGQRREALSLVTGPAGAPVLPLAEERRLLHADLAAACGEMREAVDVLRAQLTANPEDWAALVSYLDCLLPASAEWADPPACTQQQQQQHRPCASSSLLWFSGGVAAHLKGNSESPHASLGSGLGSGTQQSAADVEKGLAEAAGVVESMVAAVDKQGGDGQQQQGKGGQVTMRGPHLAKVELARRAVKLASPDVVPQKQQKLAEAILGYMHFAGHMYCCAADLRPYLPHLSPSARTWLLQQLETLSGFPALQQHSITQPSGSSASAAAADGVEQAQPVAGGERALRQRISALQVMDGLGAPEFGGEAQAVNHAQQLMQLYAGVQGLYKGLDERERGPADELPALAANALVSAALMARSDADAAAHMTRAVLLLEAAAVTRRWSAHIRLALVALHTLLANPKGAVANIEFLDLKHVQMDSMAGHFLLPALLAYSAADAKPGSSSSTGKAAAAGAAAAEGQSDARPLTKVLARMYAFFGDHRKDAGETLITAYTSGAYSKVLEFAAFKERLEASHSHLLSRAEITLDRARTCAATSTSQSATQPSTLAHQLCGQVAQAWGALGLKVAVEVSSAALNSSSSSGAQQGKGTQQQQQQQQQNGQQQQTPQQQQDAQQHLPGLLPHPPLSLMHYDEDLSTRPAWYPPLACPTHLAPACWWEARQKTALPGNAHGVQLQGSGVGWWAAPASAESPHPQAVLWRQGVHAAACARLHMPQLIISCLLALPHLSAQDPKHSSPTTTTTTSCAPSQHLARAQAALHVVAAGISGSSAGAAVAVNTASQQQQQQQLDTQLEQWVQGVRLPAWRDLPPTVQLQRLEVVLGAAMVAACSAMQDAQQVLEAPGRAVTGEHTTALDARTQLLASATQSACSAVCAMVQQAHSSDSGALGNKSAASSAVQPLPGALFACANALVHEILAWAGIFVQAWSSSLQQLQQRAKKAKASPPGFDTQLASLAAAQARMTEAWQQARAQMESCLRGWAQTQQQQQQQQQQLEQWLKESLGGSGCVGLWDWQGERGFSASAVLAGLVQGQAGLAQSLADVCARRGGGSDSRR